LPQNIFREVKLIAGFAARVSQWGLRKKFFGLKVFHISF